MTEISIERYAETLSRVYKDYGDLFALYKAAKEENDSLCKTMDKLKAQHRVEIDNLWGKVMSKEKTYNLGDVGPNGGIIFVLSKDNMHGVEAQIEDHNAMSWHMAVKHFNRKDDWRLPTKDELNALYLHKNVIGGFTNHAYWSSSEGGTLFACNQHFNSGLQCSVYKSYTLRVRVVKEF